MPPKPQKPAAQAPGFSSSPVGMLYLMSGRISDLQDMNQTLKGQNKRLIIFSMMLVVVVAVLALGYLRDIEAVAVTPDGRVVPISKRAPKVTRQAVLSRASEAVAECLSFSSVNPKSPIKAQLDRRCAPHFTNDGYHNFVNQPELLRYVQVVESQRAVSEAFVSGTPWVSETWRREDTGEVFYRVKMTADIKYLGLKGDQGRSMEATVDVKQVPLYDDPFGQGLRVTIIAAS